MTKATAGLGIVALMWAGALMPVPAQAQTGVDALLTPWPSGRPFDLQSNALFQDEGDIDATGEDVQLEQYAFTARWRQNPDALFTPLAAVSWDHLAIDTDSAALPERLVEVTALGGWGGRLDEHWQLGVLAGVGYAGNNAFGDSDAYYALADVVLDYGIDDASGWRFFLSYNGNRTFFPDLPLPAVAYYNGHNEALRYTLGLPASSAVWRPAAAWTVRARYVLPVSLDVTAEYALNGVWTAFAGYHSDTDAYHLNDDDEHRRLLFSQSRAEAGVRWQGCERAALTLAAGYAFAQEFERGFDLRDTDTVADLSDEPYLRAGLRVGF